MAPEILKKEFYNYSIDFYALGTFLHELATGFPPFYDNSIDKIM